MFKGQGQEEKNVARMVGATSSEAFLVLALRIRFIVDDDATVARVMGFALSICIYNILFFFI